MKACFKYCKAPQIADSTYKRFLRFPPARPLSPAMLDVAEWAIDWYQQHGRPWIAYTPVALSFNPDGNFSVENCELKSSRISRHFEGSERAVLVLSCAGIEAEQEAQRKWEEDEADSYYFLDSYSAAVAEAQITELRKQLQTEDPETAWSPHRCPGHGDWCILDNLKLLPILRKHLELPAEVDALSSGMLTPKKSLLGLIAGRHSG